MTSQAKRCLLTCLFRCSYAMVRQELDLTGKRNGDLHKYLLILMSKYSLRFHASCTGTYLCPSLLEQRPRMASPCKRMHTIPCTRIHPRILSVNSSLSRSSNVAALSVFLTWSCPFSKLSGGIRHREDKRLWRETWHLSGLDMFGPCLLILPWIKISFLVSPLMGTSWWFGLINDVYLSLGTLFI